MKRKNFIEALGLVISGSVLAKLVNPMQVNAKVNDNANTYTYTKEEINDLIQNAIENIPMQSYVGMFDISSTLNSIEKVKEKYGSDTEWVQHSGYVLRGASSGVVANSNVKTGGNDNAVVVKHNHGGSTGGAGTHSHSVSFNGKGYSIYSDYDFAGGSGNNPTLYNFNRTNLTSNGLVTNSTGDHSHSIPEAGEDGTNKNIPNYKSVYIWERIA